MGLGFLAEGEDPAEETVKVFCFPLACSEPLCAPGVQGVLLFEILLCDGDQGGNFVRVRVWVEDSYVVAAFGCGASSQLWI